MKVQYGEEMANHSGPESCGVYREVHAEALTGETDRPAIEPRNHKSGMPTLLSEAEGNMVHGVNRKSCTDPTRSETLCMLGSLLHGSSEISSVSDAGWSDRAGKVKDRNPATDVDEKSDTPIVPKKPLNKGMSPAEMVEGRGVAKGKADESLASRTQSRKYDASTGLEGIRETAKHTCTIYKAKTLDQLLPDANATDAKREIDEAKDAGLATLSLRDIGDTPPVGKNSAK